MASHSSILENSTDRGAWWATYSPWDCKQSDMTEQLTHDANILNFHRAQDSMLLKDSTRSGQHMHTACRKKTASH